MLLDETRTFCSRISGDPRARAIEVVDEAPKALETVSVDAHKLFVPEVVDIEGVSASKNR